MRKFVIIALASAAGFFLPARRHHKQTFTIFVSIGVKVFCIHNRPYNEERLVFLQGVFIFCPGWRQLIRQLWRWHRSSGCIYLAFSAAVFPGFRTIKAFR
jgi:hypothetical protein